MSDTIREAHAEAFARLPECCHDCGAEGDLHLAYVSGGIGDMLLCPCCAEHPDHAHTSTCAEGLRATTAVPRAVIDLVDGVRAITIPARDGGEPAVVPVGDSVTYRQLRALLAEHGWTVTCWRAPTGNRERLDAVLTPAASAA